jgi:hypothetical protein
MSDRPRLDEVLAFFDDKTITMKGRRIRIARAVEQMEMELVEADDCIEQLEAALEEAADYLAELYAKYQTKIGPFATQAQKIQGRARSALAKVKP